MRLGVPFYGFQLLAARCTCDHVTEHLSDPTTNGYHSLSCTKLPHHHKAHFSMETSLIQWVKSFAPHLNAKPELKINPTTSDMRTDVLITGFQDAGPNVHIDFTTAHVYAKTYDSKVRSGPLELARTREKEKRDKYAHLMPQNTIFIPFVVEITGGFGPATTDLLKRLRTEAELHVGPHDRIQKLISHLVARQRRIYIKWAHIWRLLRSV
jgi:hypothetical protein